ncbi:MAG: hypothetical protein OXC65_10130 [Thiotrichales bacterium]|nr:hypothetical protein [Thiotrichales bacterium]
MKNPYFFRKIFLIYKRFRNKLLADLIYQKILSNTDKELILGFYISQRKSLVSCAISPDAIHIRINFLRKIHGWNSIEVESFIKNIANLSQKSKKTTHVIVWGNRDRIHNLEILTKFFPKIIRIEDGLLYIPKYKKKKTSFIVNYHGIYFDGRQPSDLELSLNTLSPGYAIYYKNAQRFLNYIISNKMTKYRHYDREKILIDPAGLLIIGQVNEDQAIISTTTIGKTNFDLISFIIKSQAIPNATTFYYKPHPRNKENRKEIARIISNFPDIVILDSKINIHTLFAQKPLVATMTSGAGLEAALHGCTVYCFGISFYSNWGFTIDYFDCPRRKNKISAEDLAVFLWMEFTVYINPVSRRIIKPQDAFKININ